MTTMDTTRSARSVLDEARRLVPELAARGPEIEAARRLPVDLLDDLVGAGCFRVLLPPSHGGVGAGLAEALELFGTLARGDASTAWTVMIGATGWCDLAGLDRTTFDELFPPATDVIVAGAFAPSGSITPVARGYELTGRWAFASGCQHATLLFANAVERFADGHPVMRAAVLHPGEVTIEDTWHVAGLSGTGSHHFGVHGAVVPAERTFVPLTGPPCLDTPIVRVPTPTLFSLAIATVAVGVARGALDDVVALAQGKVPLLASRTLATDPVFHHGLAQADASLEAARALLAATAATTWDLATAGDEPTLEVRARARAGAAWATDTALGVAERAYRSGGGGAVYLDSPLQRRLRDLHAMAQHFLVRADTFTAAGGVLAGQPLSVPVF